MFTRGTDVVGAACVAVASFVNNSQRSKIIDKTSSNGHAQHRR